MSNVTDQLIRDVHVLLDSPLRLPLDILLDSPLRLPLGRFLRGLGGTAHPAYLTLGLSLRSLLRFLCSFGTHTR